MTVFFATKTGTNQITVTRSDAYPFKAYMIDGLGRLPEVTSVDDRREDRLILRLSRNATITADQVTAYANRMSADYLAQQERERTAQLEAIAALARALTRSHARPRRPQPRGPVRNAIGFLAGEGMLWGKYDFER